MAKELPYFKFEPAEYLTKDISFCSLAAQGLFVNICSYYWQRGCILTKEQLLRRLNYPNELSELISEGVIDLTENNISIKFLDCQLGDVEKTSVKNKVNGSKGGRPKKNPNETQMKPTLNPNETQTITQTKGIREDKIRLDEKREDNINNAKFSIQIKTPSQWSETIGMQNKVDFNCVCLYLDHFDSHLVVMQEQKESLKDYKEHFSNWFRKQDLSAFRVKSFGKTNQI